MANESISYTPQFKVSANKPSAVDEIMNKILDGVLSEQYKCGDKLPTEAQLCEMYGVSKNTVREAIKILIAYGVVEIRRPEGTFITNNAARMLNPIIYSTLFKSANAQDLQGLRRLVDTGICLLIIQQGLDPADRDALESEFLDYCKLLHADPVDVDAIQAEDERFHRLLAAATRNEMVRNLHDFVLEITHESRLRAILMCKYDDNMDYLQQTHRRTLDVVERKPGTDLVDTIDFSYHYWKESFIL